jgi:hypothetical protein
VEKKLLDETNGVLKKKRRKAEEKEEDFWATQLERKGVL